MKKLKVGIIGCGRISRFHGMPAAAQPNVELCAVCDLVPARAKQMAKLFGARKTYTDYKEMIRKEKLDVVHICLPHYLHAPVAIEAMKLGCDVLTEKPMAISMEQAEEMVKTAKKTKRKLGVIFQNRYNAGSQLVKQCLESGRLGAVKAAKCNVTWYRSNEYYTETDWKGTWDKEGGGAIIDQAIHTLDLMCWFIGYDIQEIECSMANRAHKGVIEVEDSAEGLITFKNGVRASFWAMNYYSHDSQVEIELSCENGIATIRAEEGTVRLNDGRVFTAAPNPSEVFNYGGGPSYWGASHYKEISDFYQCLAAGKQPPITGEEILSTTHKMVMAVYDSGRNGKIVKF
ncbi:MAG: Gfo/Idh/MocA family oxidoreductase [Victivallales bacterium]|nr:Gfo/Idh/MocA family oxidoreductase [Victivallales bacterium]